MSLNSTSNDTFPLLFQLPQLENIGRRRRSAEDEVMRNSQKISPPPKKSTITFEQDHVLDGGAGNLFENDLGGLPLPYDDVPSFPPSMHSVGARLRDAFVLYAMAEGSPECRSKIACVFGAAAR